MKDRENTVLSKIIQYANEINETIIRFELDFDKFKNDNVMKNAICMCILQIGELVNHLPDEFKKKHDKAKWREIVSVRNRAVHAYETTDKEILWDIASSDVPELKKYCEEILKEKEI